MTKEWNNRNERVYLNGRGVRGESFEEHNERMRTVPQVSRPSGNGQQVAGDHDPILPINARLLHVPPHPDGNRRVSSSRRYNRLVGTHFCRRGRTVEVCVKLKGYTTERNRN